MLAITFPEDVNIYQNDQNENLIHNRNRNKVSIVTEFRFKLNNHTCRKYMYFLFIAIGGLGLFPLCFISLII